MIEQWFRIICDVCENPYTDMPFMDDGSTWPADWLLTAAESDGWKVNRLVKDVYYGKAICSWCQED